MKMQDFQSYLEANIPMTKLTGYQLLHLDGERAEALSPMEVNGNHRGSAFGGSLYNSMVLTAYSWLYGGLLGLKDEYSLLIGDGHIEYSKEVREEIYCVCRAPVDSVVQNFQKVLDAKRKARILIECEVLDRGTKEVLAKFQGRFVAFKL